MHRVALRADGVVLPAAKSAALNPEPSPYSNPGEVVRPKSGLGGFGGAREIGGRERSAEAK